MPSPLPVALEAPRAAAPITIDELHSPEELQHLRPEWDRLLAAAPRATPFSSPEWLLPWLSHFGHDGLWVLAARRAGRLVGLAPLRIEETPAGRVACFAGRGVTDYSGFLVASGAPGEGVAEALLERLAARDSRWDLCDLDQIPPTDPLFGARLPRGLNEEVSAQEVCPFVPLPGSAEELSRALPHQLGARLQRSLRRLHREGRVAFERADRGSLDELLDRFFRLHADQWQARDLPGVLADATLQDFHRVVAAGMLARGRLRMYALRFEGRIESVLYGFVHGRRFYSYLSGFSPRLHHLSPGSLMIWHALTASLEEGLEAFDFLRGAEPYKYRWGAQDRWNRRRLIRKGA